MRDFAEIYIRNMGTNRIQKVTVMRYHNHTVIIVCQEIFQPINGFIIQVICGLIHDQYIGIAKSA